MTLGSSTFFPPFEFLAAQNWTDYALLDSGDGFKLEQFGHKFLAHFHSHPGNGPDATCPSRL